MNVNFSYPPRPQRRGRVIALHCSGANAGQWSYLAEALGGSYEMLAPEHYGCESAGAWGGDHAFTLADEAHRTIGLIDRSESKVHLVGHSYGGGVALAVALARPTRIASLAMYEPSAFHLLRLMGHAGADAFSEITGIARRVCRGVVTGDYRGAMEEFVDYWSGSGSFKALRPGIQHGLVRWAPKAPLDFRALIDETTSQEAYRSLAFPVLLLRGQHAPAPTRLIAERLDSLLPDSRLATIEGAGHMGPMTHAPEVSGAMVQFIETAQRGRFGAMWRAGAAGLAGAILRPVVEAAS